MIENFVTETFGLSDLGRRRRNNEDCFVFYEPNDPDERAQSGCLYIVADGVGGAAMGERASQYAAHKTLFDFYETHDPDLGARLRQAIRAANADIFAHAAQRALAKPMGTTLVAVALRGEQIVVANVGDSRAYLLRAGQAAPLTRDHSLAQQLLDEGELTPDEALHFERKNVILRSVGGSAEVAVDLFTETVAPGDALLLCTDGLHNYFPDPVELAELASAGTAEQAAHRLIVRANARGGADNLTALLVRLFAPDGAPPRAPSAVIPAPTTPDWDNLPTVIVPRRRATFSMEWQLVRLGDWLGATSDWIAAHLERWLRAK